MLASEVTNTNLEYFEMKEDKGLERSHDKTLM